MLIFAVDDEPKMLRLLHRAIAKAEPDAEIMDFEDDELLIDAVTKQGKQPDVVFADIQLQGCSGLELAVRIKRFVPQTKIIFVTGYPQYAADAYRRHAQGYILKPAEPERIREELDNLFPPETIEEPQEKLRVRCFGNFQVYLNNEPLRFKRSKTKELLAYLVDREGAFCTGGEIIAALWESGAESSNPKQYLRVLTNDLRETLAANGMEKLLIKKHNQWAIRKDMLDCDYYRMLSGDINAVNAYHGEYMSQYSWSELTAGRLYFK